MKARWLMLSANGLRGERWLRSAHAAVVASLGCAARLRALPAAVPTVAHDLRPAAVKELTDEIINEVEHGIGLSDPECQIRARISRTNVLNSVSVGIDSG
jgi:hypothetical protein